MKDDYVPAKLGPLATVVDAANMTEFSGPWGCNPRSLLQFMHCETRNRECGLFSSAGTCYLQ